MIEINQVIPAIGMARLPLVTLLAISDGDGTVTAIIEAANGTQSVVSILATLPWIVVKLFH